MHLPRAIGLGWLHRRMHRTRRRMVMRGLAFAAALLLAFPADAEELSAWQQQKCALYTEAWAPIFAASL